MKKPNYMLDEIKDEVSSVVKEVRAFLIENKVLTKDDGLALFDCLKFMITVTGDVNVMLQRWPRVNVKIYSLLGRMEMKLDDVTAIADVMYKEQYIINTRQDNKEHVARALIETYDPYKDASAEVRRYAHLVKLLERTYKLSENLLRILEQLSNNMRQETRESL